MQAFRCNDQHFGHLPFLPLPFCRIGIAITDADFPLHTQFCNHFFHGTANILCKGTQWSYPQKLQTTFGFFLVVVGMIVDEVNDGAEENGKSLTTTGRRIYKPASPMQNMLPGLLLKRERG